MNSKSKKTKLFFLSTALGGVVLSPTLIAASCAHERPIISVSSDPKYTFLDKDGNRIIRGSASEFYNTNRSGIFNPVDSSDRFYSIFKKDNNQLLNNSHDKNHKYKIKGNFDFLNFENLTAPYSFRLYSFRYDELVKNIPGVANKKIYYEQRNNPKAVYLILYWLAKSSEAAPNYVSDILTPSAARLGVPFNPEVKEEAPWPFVRGILPNNNFWKDIAEPIVLIFEKE